MAMSNSAIKTVSNQIANFFWDGPSVASWSRACINSFKKKGFLVNVYSYSGSLKKVFSGEQITICDAGDIYPQSFRDQLFECALPNSYGKTYSCFSDFFRIRLLSKQPGSWWFNTDVLCLKSSDEFERIANASSDKTICGYQTPPDVPQKKACTAVLRFGNENFAKEYYSKLLAEHPPHSQHEWLWAETAIPFLNKIISEYPEQFDIQKCKIFYPMSWHNDEMSLFLLPGHFQEAQKRCRNAFTLHFWNEIVTRKNIPRDQLPPTGSLLHDLVTKNQTTGLPSKVLDRMFIINALK